MPPDPRSALLFYADAPARPGDALYAEWLAELRSAQADMMSQILRLDKLVADNSGGDPPDLLTVGVSATRLCALLRERYLETDEISRAIIASPDAERSRELMRRVVDARK